jgi:hypothetical protein
MEEETVFGRDIVVMTHQSLLKKPLHRFLGEVGGGQAGTEMLQRRDDTRFYKNYTQSLVQKPCL